MSFSPSAPLQHGKHILFYDGDCPLCNRAVRFVLAKDMRKDFLFASLSGETAKTQLSSLHLKHPDLDSLVLLEDAGTDHEKILVESKGAFRILWLLGGKYAFIGWLCFLPSFLFDWEYRVIAKLRYRLFHTKEPIEKDDRFLP